jgi:hypothetical protein
MRRRGFILGAGSAILANPKAVKAQNFNFFVVPQVATFTDTQLSNGYFGFFDTLTNVAQRQWIIDPAGNSSDLEGWVTGTACQMTTISASITDVWVSVDGGAFFAPSVGTNSLFTLFTGLPDARHFLQIVMNRSGAANPVNALSGIVLTVTGSAPTLDFGGWGGGPAWMLTDPSFPGVYSGCSQVYAFGGNSNVRPTNSLTFNGQDFGGLSNTGYDYGCGVKVRAKCSQLWVQTGETNAGYSIDKGAVTNVSFDTANLSVYCPGGYSRTWKLFATGLDATTFHDYYCFFGSAVPNVTTPSSTVSSTLGIRTDSNGSFASTTAKRVVQDGDSITQTQLSVIFNGGQPNTNCDVYMACALQGAVGATSGVAGVTAAQLDTAMAGNLSRRGYVPDIHILAIGRNDAGVTASGPFQASITSILNKILANGTNKIIVRGVTLGTGTASLITIDGYLAAAVAAIQSSLTGSQQVIFVDTTGWTGITFYDGTHPTQAGYATMVNYWQTPMTNSGFF